MGYSFYLFLAPSGFLVGFMTNATSDRVVQQHWLLAAFGLMGAVVPGFFFAGKIQSLWLLRLLGATFGALSGGFDAVANVILANLYGTRNLGTITAISRSGVMLVGGMSPVIYGIDRDSRGNYQLVLQIACLWCIFGSAALMACGPIRKSSFSASHERVG